MVTVQTALPDLRDVRVLAALNGLELFGHERGNIEVFKALRESGAKVRVLVNARDNGGQVAQELASLGFEIGRLPFGPQWSLQWLRKEGPRFAAGQLKRVFQANRAFHRQIQAFEPTHVHLGSPLAYSFLSLALMRTDRPLIWRMGDCPPIDSRFNLPIWRLAMRRTSHAVANSYFVKDSAVSAGVPPGKVSVIYNFAPGHGEKAAQTETSPDLGGGETALIYAGAIASHKGLLPLVEAFGQALRDRPSLRLWIMGGSIYEGDFRQRLKQRIRELNIESRVLWTGHLRNPAPWYAAASLHLAPSLWEEPAANVVLEAKREGTPSIVFPSGGLPELVRHKVNGYICQEKTAAGLAAAIRWMLADRDRLATMGIAAKTDSESRFGRERFIHQWADVYRKSPVSATK